MRLLREIAVVGVGLQGKGGGGLAGGGVVAKPALYPEKCQEGFLPTPRESVPHLRCPPSTPFQQGR